MVLGHPVGNFAVGVTEGCKWAACVRHDVGRRAGAHAVASGGFTGIGSGFVELLSAGQVFSMPERHGPGVCGRPVSLAAPATREWRGGLQRSHAGRDVGRMQDRAG